MSAHYNDHDVHDMVEETEQKLKDLLSSVDFESSAFDDFEAEMNELAKKFKLELQQKSAKSNLTVFESAVDTLMKWCEMIREEVRNIPLVVFVGSC